MRMLFFAHSGLRYLVLLMGLVAVAYFAYGLATKRPVDKSVRILGSSFVGLLDTQILLGIGLAFAWPVLDGRIWTHMVTMLLAAGVAHVLLVVNRRRPNPNYALPLAAVAGALILVFIGIVMVLDRSLFGTTKL
ncbi:hypothetical protein [Archangium lansingense]|uniref:Uncharacterized protein n=1 Tax=Archangium lansingense TaxID=2995310 RepID=A0ABT4AGU1_9BACT|nr:hypothetical protein [Archangium lansinium]MCY1080526.1 hypothetical protein [Archangium lansinium]